MGHFIQINDANWRIPYVGGWCEGYVEGAWGKATQPTPSNPTTSGIYGSATQAWEAVQNKHYDMPPLGVTVPVYFSLGNVWQGHVAIRLDDGMVASSTQSGYHSQGYIHPNIQNMIDLYGKYNGGCTYLGWADRQWGIEIVRYEANITQEDKTSIETIPFQTEITYSETIPVGTQQVLQTGVNGSRTIITRLTYSDGVQTGLEVVSDTSIQPTNERIVQGVEPTTTTTTTTTTTQIIVRLSLWKKVVKWLLEVIQNAIEKKLKK